MSFFVKFADGTFATLFCERECDAWAFPGVIRCEILGGGA